MEHEESLSEEIHLESYSEESPLPKTQPKSEQEGSESQTTRIKPKSRRRIPLSNPQIILLFLIIIGGGISVDFSQRVVDGQQKLEELQLLEGQIESLTKENQELEAAKLFYSSSAFIEAWAHSEGKMVREGETLVIPMVDGSTEFTIAPPSVPITTLPEDTTPEWQIWWNLFFESDPPAP